MLIRAPLSSRWHAWTNPAPSMYRGHIRNVIYLGASFMMNLAVDCMNNEYTASSILLMLFTAPMLKSILILDRRKAYKFIKSYRNI